MTRKIVAGFAAVAALALVAEAPAADAGPLKRGARSAHAAQFKSLQRNAKPRQRTVGGFSSGHRPQANPGQAAINYALALYVRRCLDNILPECPK